MGIFSWIFGKENNNGNVRKRDNQLDVVDVQTEDEKMNWAIKKSNLTLHYCNGERSVQRLNTYKSDNGWKVMSSE